MFETYSVANSRTLQFQLKVQSNLCLKIPMRKETVFAHRWSLITGSFMQKIRNWEIYSVIVIDRELLNKGGLNHTGLTVCSMTCFPRSRFDAARSIMQRPDLTRILTG